MPTVRRSRETARCSAVLVVLVGVQARIAGQQRDGHAQRGRVVSGVGEAMTMAASTKSLFRRGLSKKISSAATFPGKAIRQTARDRDETLEKFSHHIAGEIQTWPFA